MSFAALQRANADFITSHVLGEAIEYRRSGYPTWTSINAQVDRNPLDIGGIGVIQNTIDVFVSRTAVANVFVAGDQFRLAAAALGEEKPRYKVAEIDTRADGYYRLRCVK